MIHIFIGPAWPKTTFNQLEVFVIKLLSLLRIINFKYLQSLHHLPRLYFIRTLREYGRNDNLKVGSNGHQSAMIIIHIGMCEMLKWIFIALFD